MRKTPKRLSPTGRLSAAARLSPSTMRVSCAHERTHEGRKMSAPAVKTCCHPKTGGVLAADAASGQDHAACDAVACSNGSTTHTNSAHLRPDDAVIPQPRGCKAGLALAVIPARSRAIRSNRQQPWLAQQRSGPNAKPASPLR